MRCVGASGSAAASGSASAEVRRLRETLGVEQRPAHVRHGHPPAELRGLAHERDRVVAGAADDAAAWAAGSARRGPARHPRRGRGVPARAPWLRRHRSPAGGSPQSGPVSDRHQAGALRRTERRDGLARAGGRLHEDLDRAVAAQAVAPHRVVVGGQVELAGEARPSRDHLPADAGHVALQAAAADVADRLAVGGYEAGAHRRAGRWSRWWPPPWRAP